MKKLMTMLGAAGLAWTACAAVNDTLMTFSTVGPDKYADGTTVLDGECYALVWSAGEFAGVKADGTAVDPADEIVLLAPLAKDGKCPMVLFQVDAATVRTTGSYSVYLLDTRVKAADGTLAVGGVKNGKAPVVNGFGAVAEGAAAGEATAGAVALAAPQGGVSVGQYVQVDSPKITGIKMVGAKVQITVAGMLPVAEYKVVTGAKPGELATEIPAKAEGDTFTFDKPAGAFFKVIGVRNVQ